MIGLTFIFPDHPGIWMANMVDRFIDTNIRHEMDLWRAGSGDSIFVATTASVVEVLWEIIRGTTDTLRFGSGVDNGIRALARGDFRGFGSGVLDDVLRALNIIPVGVLFGKGIARVTRLLAVRQGAGTVLCEWVATANAASASGQALFLSEKELMRVSGVTADMVNAGAGTDLAMFRQLQAGLRRLGIRSIEHTIHNLAHFSAVVKAHPNSIFKLSIDYEVWNNAGRFVGHSGHGLYARLVRGAVVFVDTNGLEYRGLEALERVYPGATMHAFLPVQEFPISALVRGNDFMQLFFPVGRAIYRQIADPPARPAPQPQPTMGVGPDRTRAILRGR
jgi:hypothetical protein